MRRTVIFEELFAIVGPIGGLWMLALDAREAVPLFLVLCFVPPAVGLFDARTPDGRAESLASIGILAAVGSLGLWAQDAGWPFGPEHAILAVTSLHLILVFVLRAQSRLDAASPII